MIVNKAMRVVLKVLMLSIVSLGSSEVAAQPLKVSSNKRFLVKEGGQPFFYLGDTAWELFHRLSREEANYYLTNRAAKGFTVIQAVILAELNGLKDPNPYGHLPLTDLDPTKPNEKYFEHVDYVIKKAEELGLFVALLPTWGGYVVKEKHFLYPIDPIFTPANAAVYGKYLGNRYRNQPNIIWILGGDRVPEGYEEIWQAMAKGIKEGDKGNHLISYHSSGYTSSSKWFHQTPWLDFNMIQSGHERRANNNYDLVQADYNLSPAKPTFDGEPGYENAPVGFDPANGVFNDFSIRQAAYWSVFSGAFGHTYGASEVWQMYSKERTPLVWAEKEWKEALDYPGSFQLRHLRNLIESRPFLTRIPDQRVILPPKGLSTDYIVATRDGTIGKKDASYILAYTPTAKMLNINTSVIPGKKIKVWWYDPREGTAHPLGEYENKGTFGPSWNQRPWLYKGPDWVLVIDDASEKYPAPGEKLAQK